MVNTLAFTVVIGYIPGYDHNNKEVCNDPREIWQSIAGDELESSGIYVSATAVDGKTIYSTNWGFPVGSTVDGKTIYSTDWDCPVGGERTVVFSGSANPEFVKDVNEWRESVIRVVRDVKAALEQSTVAIEFTEVEHVYLT